MPGKLDIQKLTWGWVNDTQPGNITQEHVEIAYRLRLPKCPAGSCRRNCQKNPYCFECLFKKEKEQPSLFEDLDLEPRDEGALVGLSNLGATCYVNCFLQLWYHNCALRRAIYNYELPLSDQQSDDDCNLESYAKGDQVGQLQCLFALLQFSQRKNIDPSFFIKSLNLNANEQQDAQEFSKLFLSLIEGHLNDQRDSNVRNIIRNLFQGTYEYNTRCNFCGKVSVNSSTFYELDLNIGGQQSLLGCLQEYVKEEKLENDEKYYCSNCMEKRDAVRNIKLKELPPFLNLQLLRFVYNRQTSRKTKLKNLIEFPEVLDMSSFIETPDPILYDLNAVLIHRGTSAYEGHYVAVIKDHESNKWYEFSDDLIKKLKGSSLQLDGEEESVAKPSAVNQLPKGILSSRNAYMLVYQKRNAPAVENQNQPWNIPPRLDKVIKADNTKFEELMKDLQNMKDENESKSQQEEEELLDIWKQLPAVPGEAWEFLSITWINKWLSRKIPLEAIDNQCQLCAHEKMPPNAVTKFKCVKKQVVETLYEKFGGGPRITKEYLCKECVTRECLTRRVEMQLHEDAKIVNLKTVNKAERLFWVGKRSFQSWRKLALQNVVPQESNSDSPDLEEFNNDLLCTHGNLNVNKSTRKLVSHAAWKIFKKYFPNALEYSHLDEEEECPLCQDVELNKNETKRADRELALNQRSLLADLYHGKNRPPMDKSSIKCYAVLYEFITSWRRFLRLPSRYSSVVEVCNSDILCKHGQLLCPIIDTDKYVHPQPDERPVLLWEEEWKLLQEFVTVDQELIVTTVTDDTENEMAVTVKHQPDICPECYAVHCAAQSERQIDQLLRYKNGSIYIRLVPNKDEDTESSSGDSKLVPSTDIKTGANRNKRTKSANDINGQQKVTAKSNKRKKMCDMPSVHGNNSHVEETKVRRSSRHQRTRGEVVVRMSSDNTLRDLKIEILNHFGVAPVHQQLSLNSDRELTKNDATLEELRVVPGSTIYLKVDDDIDDFLEEKALTYEEGFKGTGLLRH